MAALEAADMAVESSEVTKRAENEVELSHDDGVKVLRLVDALEDLDDVVDVYTNADFPESVYEES
jgi:transcriptional/translational regulatory protein YebC/TACO1